MDAKRLLKTAVIPALEELESSGIKSTPEARQFMLSIALQESGLKHRRQVTSSGKEEGPASSFWQFEALGGCKGVLNHRSTSSIMQKVCASYNVEATPQSLWEAMRYNDIVAACAARLLIYTLPQKLPTTPEDGWAQYVSAWRPGKPHPEKWLQNWIAAGLANN